MRPALRGHYRQVTRRHLALLVGALVYIVSPIDLLPEGLLGIFGLADDTVVLGWLVAALVKHTEGFLQWERARDGAREEARSRDAGPQDDSASSWDSQVSSRVVG